ncbi:hypothetical protein NQZ68_028558 [Dissostichus eleginoides]|nr:hypothetical protein NQZ68_028558 [Dissostichus eleginoides]
MHFILNTVRAKLVSMGLEKKEVKVFRPWRKKKDQKPAATPEPVPQVSEVQPKHVTDHLISPRVPSLDVAWLQEERGYTDKNQEEKQWENQEENQEEKNQEENQENV